MSENHATVTTLRHLLDHDVSRFISAEIELKASLPGWIENAGSLKLKGVLQKYLEVVNKHLEKLETFIVEEKIIAVSIQNRVMLAFIEETNEKTSQCKDAFIKDACLLACIQAINHFKISAFGTAAAFANALGMENQAAVFHEAEVSEKQIDDRLSQLAEHEINVNAKTPIALE